MPSGALHAMQHGPQSTERVRHFHDGDGYVQPPQLSHHRCRICVQCDRGNAVVSRDARSMR
eukprot:682638-Lingulodinium_polyedra.AAC.1